MILADDEGIDYGQLMAMYEDYMNTVANRTKDSRTGLYLISAYLLAIVLANLLVVTFGPGISVINAFLFIGLDLTTRDHLHELWQGRSLWPKMLMLVGCGSLLSYLLNRAAGPIAIASLVAFSGAGVTDTFVYWLLGEKSRLVKINGSNIVSAGVDSLLFPILAFGLPVLWLIILGQFLAKITGGFIWSVLLGAGRAQKETRGL